MFKFKTIDLQKLPLGKIFIVGQFLVIIFSIRSCNLKDLEVSQSGLKIQMYQNQAQSFSKSLNKLGEEVSTQKELSLLKDKQLEKALLKNSALQSLNQQIALTQVTELPVSTSAPFENSLKKIIDSTKCVPVGTQFSKNDPWYTIKGGITDTGVVFNKLSFKDSLTINIGKKRQPGLMGYLKTKDNVIEVINSNPYSHTSNMKNISLNDPKAWYETKLFTLTLGIILGVAIVKL